MPPWLESAAGSLFGSGLLLAGLKVVWAKLEAKEKVIQAMATDFANKLSEKDKEIAALNDKLAALAERRISDLREMLKPQSSSSR